MGATRGTATPATGFGNAIDATSPGAHDQWNYAPGYKAYITGGSNLNNMSAKQRAANPNIYDSSTGKQIGTFDSMMSSSANTGPQYANSFAGNEFGVAAGGDNRTNPGPSGPGTDRPSPAMSQLDSISGNDSGGLFSKLGSVVGNVIGVGGAVPDLIGSALSIGGNKSGNGILDEPTGAPVTSGLGLNNNSLSKIGI